MDSLSTSLKEKGFFYNHIDTVIKKNNHYASVFKLGKRIDSIKLTTSNIFKLKKDTIISTSNLLSFLQKIKNKIELNGRTFSKVYLENIFFAENQLTASIGIRESEKRFIDKIIIKGYREFPKKFLKHFLKLRNKTVFNTKTIENLKKDIESIDFIKQKKAPQVLFTKDSTIVYLYLEKLKNSYFDGDLNLAPSTEEKKLQFSGNINLSLSNLINKGEQLKLHWNANGRERQNIELSLNIPFIFNTSISLKNQLNIHKQDSSFLNTNFKTSLTHQLTPKMNFGILFESENSINTLNKQTNNINDFSNYFLGSKFSYKTPNRHSLFNTTFLLDLKYSIGRRTTKESQTTQQKVKFKTSYLLSINERNHIFIKNESAFLKSANYFQNELFRIGGFNSIRGFDQQSIFSSKYSFLNLEYRLLTSNKSFLYSISDLGIIEPKENNAISVFGFGIGFFQKRRNSIINTAITSSYSKRNKRNNINLSISISSFF